MPGEGDIDGFGLPHLHMMRIVTYPLRGIERLLERLSTVPSKVADVVKVSHAWVRNRMQQDQNVETALASVT